MPLKVVYYITYYGFSALCPSSSIWNRTQCVEYWIFSILKWKGGEALMQVGPFKTVNLNDWTTGPVIELNHLQVRRWGKHLMWVHHKELTIINALVVHTVQCIQTLCNLGAHSTHVHWANYNHKHKNHQTTLLKCGWNKTANVYSSHCDVTQVSILRDCTHSLLGFRLDKASMFLLP